MRKLLLQFVAVLFLYLYFYIFLNKKQFLNLRDNRIVKIEFIFNTLVEITIC